MEFNKRKLYKRAKTILLDYDFLLAIETNSLGYCLSDRTVQLCIALLQTAGWGARYFSDIGTVADLDKIQDWSDTAQRELMVNCCPSWRNNPLNPVQIQTSCDGGLTWQDAFTLQVSTIVSDIQLQINLSNLYYQWSLAVSNTEINIYAPVTTFNTTTGETATQDDYRDIALCYACKYYIDIVCEAIKAVIDQHVTLFDVISAAVGIVALLLAPFTGFTSLAISAGIVAGIVALGAAALDFITTAVLDDAGAREIVACALYAQLQGLAPTFENFIAQAAAIDVQGANPVLIAQAIGVVVSEAGSQLNQFNSFVNVLAEGYVLGGTGLIYCPCLCSNYPSTGWTLDTGSYDAETGLITGAPAAQFTYLLSSVQNVTLVQWIDSASDDNVGTMIIDYFNGASLVRHHVYSNGYSGGWINFTESSNGATAVDKVVLSIDWTDPPAIYTVHDVKVCVE